MSDLPWHQAFEHVKSHVVRISTPSGSGTGFLVSRSTVSNVIAIATAAHVIDHAQYWEQPIRVEHFESGKSLLLRHSDRAVFLEADRDTAAIVFGNSELPFPDFLIELGPEDKFLKVGCELGWAGFPAVSNSNLCFFSGRVSAQRQHEHAYLVDGVAINGVSGGPAFFNGDGKLSLVGVVSAYIPNRATGTVLPGLSIIRDVSQFHNTAKTFKSLDEARAKQSEPQEPSPQENAPNQLLQPTRFPRG